MFGGRAGQGRLVDGVARADNSISRERAEPELTTSNAAFPRQQISTVSDKITNEIIK